MPNPRESTTSTNFTSDQIFKVPQTPPNRPIQAKIPRSNKKTEIKATSTANNSIDSRSNKSDDYDPTYGFVNRFSDTKSYFRTHNVDSIPNSVNAAEILLGCESTPVMDVLFPLRHDSGGSEKSESSWLHKRSFDDKENMTSCEEPTFPKKRVKFEDLETGHKPSEFDDTTNIHRMKPSGYDFSNVSEGSENRISLKQRIVDFFANMF